MKAECILVNMKMKWKEEENKNLSITTTTKNIENTKKKYVHN